jgi:hypothetical protein
MRQIAGFLVRGQKRDDDLPRVAALATESLFDLQQWKAVTQVGAKPYQGEPSGVLALAAVGAVEVRIIDMREGCGLKPGVFHLPTVAPSCCGLLLYNSYSVGGKRVLYGDARNTRNGWVGLGDGR